MEHYTNSELSIVFYRVVTSPHNCTDSEIRNVQSKREIIAKHDENIAAYYRRYEFLNGLKMKEFGRTNMEILELILSEGAEAAKEFVAQRRSNKMYKVPQIKPRITSHSILVAENQKPDQWETENLHDNIASIVEGE